MENSDLIVSVVKDVLGHEPDLDKSFIAEGGDSFNAIVLLEKLDGSLEKPVDLESLLSDDPLRKVLGVY